jgi:hypothetical protein
MPQINILNIDLEELSRSCTCIQQKHEQCLIPIIQKRAGFAGFSQCEYIVQSNGLKRLSRYFGRFYFMNRVLPFFRFRLTFIPKQEGAQHPKSSM